ncbi:Alpha/Beta hydrolase protein [Mycena filopes]|nr:Alpha/Beta hydrolase protein [Mycena filopes]
MAEHAHLSTPDPELEPHLERLLAEPDISDVQARRERTRAMISSLKASHADKLPPDTDYQVTDHHIDVSEEGRILLRSLVPTSEDGMDTYPLMVWMHGGGWIAGTLELDDYELRQICVDLQISILNVDYRLAPEHSYSTILDDCYSALKWAASSAELLHADLTKGFIVGGLSAGAHLATVLAHRARDDAFFAARPLTGQVLQIPPLLHPHATPEKYKSSLLSLKQNKAGPGLTLARVMYCWDQLGGDPADAEVSPLLYPTHEGLAPAVLQVCGLDPLRDEGLLYARVLEGEGVKTRVATYPGLPHAFHYMFPNFKMVAKWEEDYRAGLRWLLAGAPR